MGQIGDAPLLKLLGRPCPPVARQATTKSSIFTLLMIFFPSVSSTVIVACSAFFDTTRSFSLLHIGMLIILVHLRVPGSSECNLILSIQYATNVMWVFETKDEEKT